jgi:hypothetical protein
MWWEKLAGDTERGGGGKKWMTNDELINSAVVAVSRARTTRDIDTIFYDLEHTVALTVMPSESKVKFWTKLRDSVTRTEKAQAAGALGDLYNYARQ